MSSRKRRKRFKPRTTHFWIAGVIAAVLLIYFGVVGSDKPKFDSHVTQHTAGAPAPSVQSPVAHPSPTSAQSPQEGAKKPLEDGFDFTPKPTLQKSIAERFGKAEVIVQSPDVRESERFFTRSTLYRTHFKYSLLRVDDRYEKDENGEPKLVSRNVRVADHLLVKIREQISESDFTKSIETLGFKIRKKMSTPRHYLVQFSAPNPEALDRARDSIKGLSGVESVDPDFIVSVD